MKRNNCLNCGASLDIKNKEVVKCAYCGTEYNIDPITKRINEYIIELTVMGKKRKFYIGGMEINRIYNDYPYRNLRGNLVETGIDKMKLELIEM